METRDIKELRWIAENSLQPIVRVSMPEIMAIACFILACITLETPAITWSFVALTIFFIERHIAWCFGKQRHDINRRNHGR